MTPATCRPDRTQAREVRGFSIPLWAASWPRRSWLSTATPLIAPIALFWQRLWKRRIVSKLRDLDILLRLSEDDDASQGLTNLYGRKINGQLLAILISM